MIVNRLKGIWKSFIKPSQASFVQGRQGIKNIVICQDIIYSLSYTTAKSGGVVIKLDLEKAYDRMDWGYITDTLKDVDFPSKMIKANMGIITRNKYILLWSGELSDQI